MQGALLLTNSKTLIQNTQTKVSVFNWLVVFSKVINSILTHELWFLIWSVLRWTFWLNWPQVQCELWRKSSMKTVYPDISTEVFIHCIETTRNCSLLDSYAIQARLIFCLVDKNLVLNKFQGQHEFYCHYRQQTMAQRDNNHAYRGSSYAALLFLVKNKNFWNLSVKISVRESRTRSYLANFKNFKTKNYRQGVVRNACLLCWNLFDCLCNNVEFHCLSFTEGKY